MMFTLSRKRQHTFHRWWELVLCCYSLPDYMY